MSVLSFYPATDLLRWPTHNALRRTSNCLPTLEAARPTLLTGLPYDHAIELLEPVRLELGARELTGDNRIVKVSVVGVGMRSHAGVATQMFDALAAESINIQMISTSEIKISVVIAERYLELAVRAIHSAFGLEKSTEKG